MKLKRILAGIIACTMVATAMGVTAFAADTEPTDIVTTTETEILAGDIDNDGDVDMQDALILARYLVSGGEEAKAAFAELMELNLDAARDENGDINLSSIINVLKEVVKTIPVETTPDETTVDTDETTVETDETTVETDETTVETDETTVETDETTVDTDETTVETSLEELVAEYDAVVDSYEGLVDSDSYALISNQPAIMVAVGNAMIAIDEVDVEDTDSVKAAMATVNSAIAKITAAITEIEAAQIPAVLAEIQVIVDDAGELVEDDYTADSFAALIAALVANDALTEDSSLAEIIAVKQSLVSAMAGLVTVLEEAQANLDAVIADAEALKAADYTADSWEAVSTALTEAKALEEATVAEINAAKVALEDAVAALVLQADVDQAAYDAAVAELNTYIKTNGANYNAYKDIQGEVVDEVNAAILAMYEVANAEDITEVTPIIVAAVEAIKEASATFVLNTAATELSALIVDTKKLVPDEYTTDTWGDVKDAIAEAEELFEDDKLDKLKEDVTLAEVTDAKTAIVEAVDALVSAHLEAYVDALAAYNSIKADADFNAVKNLATTKDEITLAEAAIAAIAATAATEVDYEDATDKLNDATKAIIVEIANKVGSNVKNTGEYEVALTEYEEYYLASGDYYVKKSITQDNVGLVAEVALYHGSDAVYSPKEKPEFGSDFDESLTAIQTYIAKCRTATPKISAATATLKASYEAALADAKDAFAEAKKAIETDGAKYLTYTALSAEDTKKIAIVAANGTNPTLAQLEAGMTKIKDVALDVTIKFDINGATAGTTPADVKIANGAQLAPLPGGTGLTLEGSVFKGWGTTKGAEESGKVAVDATYSADTILYAIWATA